MTSKMFVETHILFREGVVSVGDHCERFANPQSRHLIGFVAELCATHGIMNNSAFGKINSPFQGRPRTW